MHWHRILAPIALFSSTWSVPCDATEISPLTLGSTTQRDDSRQLETAILSLELVNAVTDTSLLTLVDGAVVNANNYFSKQNAPPLFSIKAVPVSDAGGPGVDTIQSILFGLDDQPTFHIENTAPYLLCGNNGRNVYPCSALRLSQGSTKHTVTATPYSERGAQGAVVGPGISMSFTILNSLSTAPTTATTQTPFASPKMTMQPSSTPSLVPSSTPLSKPSSKPSSTPSWTPSLKPVLAINASRQGDIDAPTIPVATAPTFTSTAPLQAPTVAPAASRPPQTPMSSNATKSALQGCYLRNLRTGIDALLATKTETAYRIRDSSTNEIDGFSIRCEVTSERQDDIKFIKFLYNGKEHDEFAEPRWLNGDSYPVEYIVPVAYLTEPCGNKTITVQGHHWEGLRFVQSYTLVVECNLDNGGKDAAAPVQAPVQAPLSTLAPVTQTCSIPKLVGTWQGRSPHFPVAEAQGAMIGTTMLIVGGFEAGYQTVSTQTYAYDTSNGSATWERMDDYPFAPGVTHAGFVVVGTKFYMCGGYAGGGIGMHTDVCMVYDHSKQPGRDQQWSTFAKLPDGGRGGGHMVYDSTLNALIFAGGATRPIQMRTAIDHNNTWLYSLTNATAGWKPKAPIPFMANHMSAVTARDAYGRERHYWTGGQKQEDEYNGNRDNHYEYNALNDTWIQRAPMTLPRSHHASSTRAIGCGFIMVAGCTNGGLKIADISYYDSATDSWTKIGDLDTPINTPVCDISNGMLVCDTGFDSGYYAGKIGITL